MFHVIISEVQILIFTRFADNRKLWFVTNQFRLHNHTSPWGPHGVRLTRCESHHKLYFIVDQYKWIVLVNNNSKIILNPWRSLKFNRIVSFQRLSFVRLVTVSSKQGFATRDSFGPFTLEIFSGRQKFFLQDKGNGSRECILAETFVLSSAIPRNLASLFRENLHI